MHRLCQRLAAAKQQVYDFTIEVVSDMNRIAHAFGMDVADEKALNQCWEDLQETSLRREIWFLARLAREFVVLIPNLVHG